MKTKTGTIRVIKEDRSTCGDLIRYIGDSNNFSKGDLRLYSGRRGDNFYQHWEPIQIIVTCNDKIGPADYFLKDSIVYINGSGEVLDGEKVLVLSNQISPEIIQQLIEGKLRDEEQVEVETDMKYKKGDIGLDFDIVIKLNNDFAIIHPIKSSKETVEEAAKTHYPNKYQEDENKIGYNLSSKNLQKAFIDGAKWKEESQGKVYTDEQFNNIVLKFIEHYQNINSNSWDLDIEWKIWWNQNKK